jgi:RNA polymerase sigma-70 factor (ECF subfamily)
MTNSRECEVAERFLSRADEDSFNSLFRIISPQLVAFFRRRGHDMGIAEDLAQEVMFTVYRRAGQIRDHKLFRAWLFKVARNAACRHFAQGTRRVPTVDLSDMSELPAARNYSLPGGPAFEFRNWMNLLEPHEREALTLRFVEEREYQEIAEVQAIPVGTARWRVFNSKKKLAGHLTRRRDVIRKAA